MAELLLFGEAAATAKTATTAPHNKPQLYASPQVYPLVNDA